MKHNAPPHEFSPRPSSRLVPLVVGLGLGWLLGHYRPADEPPPATPAAIAHRTQPAESSAGRQAPRIEQRWVRPETTTLPGNPAITAEPPSAESAGQGLTAELTNFVERAESTFRQRWTDLEAAGTRFSPTAIRSAIREARVAREEALRRVFDDRHRLAYELENTQLGSELASQTRRLELTPSETADLLSLEKDAADSAMAAALGADTPDAPEQWQAQEDRKKALLGPERYDRYERLKDPVYQALEDLANRGGLDPETATAALEAHRAFTAVVTRTAGDPEAIQSVTLGGVAAVRQAHVQRMTSILGTEGARTYLRTILTPDLNLDLLLDSTWDDVEPMD